MASRTPRRFSCLPRPACHVTPGLLSRLVAVAAMSGRDTLRCLDLGAALDLTVSNLADPSTAEVGARMATRWLDLWLADQPSLPSVFQVRRVVNALCALQSADHRGRATGFLRAAAGGVLPSVSNYGF